MAIPDEDPRVPVYAMAGIYLFGGFRMSDDRNRSGGQDRARINLSEAYEVRDWSEKFGVSEARLRAAVGKVGDRAEDVERELRG
ncbi:hypothetical protein ASD25_08855 [Brevundimonas sp. Root1423]|nr:hypothetical protein ASD25_08855 [Brevundimonas sp. Root1423]